MKKISFLLVALIPLVPLAQPSAGGGIGYDFASGKAIVDIYAGYVAHNVTAEAEMLPTLKRNITECSPEVHNYLGLKIGYKIAQIITPSVGYYYNLVSTNDKELNSAHVGYSTRVIIPVSENGGVYLNAMWINKSCLATAGLYIKF